MDVNNVDNIKNSIKINNYNILKLKMNNYKIKY